MRILLVDDESLARDRLRSQIEELGDHEVVGEAGNGLEALEQVQALQPQIVLLDIRMPGMDGIETAQHLNKLENPPAVIFTTAYDQHTLDAFEANASGYLLKPIRTEKLKQALARANKVNRAQLDLLHEARPNVQRTHICARMAGKLQLIPLESVLYFKADQKYVNVCHLQGQVLIEEPLKALEEEFASRFIRIHRATLVAKQWVAGLEKIADGKWQVKIKGVADSLEVSRRHAADVRRLLKTL